MHHTFMFSNISGSTPKYCTVRQLPLTSAARPALDTNRTFVDALRNMPRHDITYTYRSTYSAGPNSSGDTRVSDTPSAFPISRKASSIVLHGQHQSPLRHTQTQLIPNTAQQSFAYIFQCSCTSTITFSLFELPLHKVTSTSIL